MLQRPTITEELITQINELIKTNPDWHRTKISKHICELWDWRFPDGRNKEISCRDMLRALDKAGKITLPESKASSKLPANGRALKPLQIMIHDTTAVAAPLSALMPLRLETDIRSGLLLDEYKSYIEQYHYLGFGRTVGENMKYMVYSNSNVLLSCLLFGSAAWSCRDRDVCIGWDRATRAKNLQLITNNTRFLILPWVRVSCLASHILSIVARRVSADWESKYGHPVYCLETFVERDRFKGTCYKAANWAYIGETTGRGRDDRYHDQALPTKDVYLFPLKNRWKESLLA